VAVFFVAASISSAVRSTVTLAVAVPAALTIRESAAAVTLSGASAQHRRASASAYIGGSKPNWPKSEVMSQNVQEWVILPFLT
jgi:hypothetical protein